MLSGPSSPYVRPIDRKEPAISIAFTIDMTAQAFALAAFALIGVGMLAFAQVAASARPGHRGWAGFTLLIALLMLVTAGSYATGNGDLTDLLLLLTGGAVLLPAWLVWTGVIGRAEA